MENSGYYIGIGIVMGKGVLNKYLAAKEDKFVSPGYGSIKML